MNNSFLESSSILMSERMPKFLFPRIRILNQNSNSFCRISIFLNLSLWIKSQNSISKLFQTLSSNLFDLNPWPISKFLSLRKFKHFHSNSKFHLNLSISAVKIGNPFPYLFLAFGPIWHGSPLLSSFNLTFYSQRWPIHLPAQLGLVAQFSPLGPLCLHLEAAPHLPPPPASQ
jgi:hypothetical protein